MYLRTLPSCDTLEEGDRAAAMPWDRQKLDSAQPTHEWRGGSMKPLLVAPQSQKPVGGLGRLLENPQDSWKSHRMFEQHAVMGKNKIRSPGFKFCLCQALATSCMETVRIMTPPLQQIRIPEFSFLSYVLCCSFHQEAEPISPLLTAGGALGHALTNRMEQKWLKTSKLKELLLWPSWETLAMVWKCPGWKASQLNAATLVSPGETS